MWWGKFLPVSPSFSLLPFVYRKGAGEEGTWTWRVEGEERKGNAWHKALAGPSSCRVSRGKEGLGFFLGGAGGFSFCFVLTFSLVTTAG